MTHIPAKRADATRNYHRLIEAAQAVFSEQGALAPLEEVAKRAGVGIGTLYRHFPTRKDLLMAVYATKLGELAEKAQKEQGLAPDLALADWLHAVVDYSAKYSGLRQLISMVADDKNEPLIAAGADLLERAQKNGSLRDDITIFDIFQLIRPVADAGAAQLEKMPKLLSVILDGLKARLS